MASRHDIERTVTQLRKDGFLEHEIDWLFKDGTLAGLIVVGEEAESLRKYRVKECAYLKLAPPRKGIKF